MTQVSKTHFIAMTHKIDKKIICFAVKIMKNVLYELPIDSKEDPAKSSCGKDKDVLSVKWEVGNNFELIFSLENSTYNLSNFTITLNVSNLFNDSMGE